ncbi:hypothetical protein ACSBR1_006819 [Camellia fascicularis]
MSDNHDSNQVLNGSGAVENGDSNDFQSAPVRDDDGTGTGYSGEVSVNQEPSSLQVDHVDHSNGVLLTRGDSVENGPSDVKLAEDGGKEEMFVDCPDELIVSDNREAMAIPETEERSDEKDDLQDTHVHESDNRTQVHDLTDELVHLRAMLEKTIGEKEGSAKDYKEERDAFMKELAKLCQQLKALNGQRSVLNENLGDLVNGLPEEEMGDVGQKISLSDNALHDMMNECSMFVRNALEVQLQTEGKFKELHAMLFMKDQEIEDLHAKVTELSISHDVVVSSLSTAHRSSDSLKALLQVEDEHQSIEAITNRVVASLAMVANEEELLDDSITGKISLVEKNTSLLVEKYNNFLSEIDLLRQCLTEVRSDFSVQDEFGTTFVAARDALLELKRKEVDLAEKIIYLEDENKKLVEQLDKSKEMEKMANADVEKVRAELEHEKARYANTKEKLSLAVTKGKALVQQRDSLKQSLAEKTSVLEKCLTELQEKSSALEAAEKSKEELVGAENFVASLQETLSQRDTVLAKCEDVLSQITAPQEIQSADIMERIRWLADERNTLNSALSQRDTILAECEDVLSLTTASQELQSTDMMERIRWLVDERNTLKGVALELHKLIDGSSLIDVQEKFSSSDLESRVSWLVESFSQAKGEANKLQDEIARTSEAAHNEIERLTASLLAETQEKNYLQDEIVRTSEAAHNEMERLTTSLLAETLEKNFLQEELEELTHKYKEIVEKECQVSVEKDRVVSMLLEVSGITKDSQEEAGQPASDAAMLIDRCFGKIKDQSNASLESSGLDAEIFERIQTLLYIKHQELMLCEELLEEDTPVRSKVNALSDELSVVSQELQALKHEKNAMQKDLERSEEKSALLREKLSMAVKKGKGLVQERENSKKLLDEKNAEIQKLKLQSQQQESALGDCKGQISKLSTDVEQIPKLEADLTTMKDLKDQLEQFLVESNNMLQRVVESIDGIVLPIDSTFKEPVEKVQWFVGFLNECQVAKKHVEEEVEKLKMEAGTLSSNLAEANTAKESVEEALSIAENNLYRLSEEKRELEVGKTHAEQELQKALEEASSQVGKLAEVYAMKKSLEDALSEAENKISTLMNETEDAQLSRAAAETELEKAKEEVSIQSTKLSEAFRTVKSLEDAMSQVETNVSLLSEENNDVKVGRNNLESAMKQLKEEADSQASKLADANSTIKSLEEALLKAENNISELVGEKKNAEEEISALNSKVNACMEELAGTNGSLESRSLELSSHVNNLQLLLKDETLVSLLRRSFETKFESLKDMDLLLEDIKDHFVKMESETLQSYPVTEQDSYVSKFSDGLDNIAIVEMENGEGNAEGGDSFESNFRKTVEGFHFRNKILADKVKGFSTSMDEFIAALLTKLRATRDEVVVKIEQMRSLKQEVNNLEMDRQAQENKIAMLENDITILGSVCTDATHELKIEVENNPVELSSVSELKKLNYLLSEAREFSVDAVADHQLGLDGSKYIKTAENLLLAAGNARALIGQFENVRNVLVTAIEDLENKCTETRRNLENAIEERDLKQSKISKLESDLQLLQNSDQEMRFKLEDYQAKEDKLKDREAEISSLSATAIKDLENKLTETRITLENAIGERDFNQNKISKLESDLQSLENSYEEMRFNLEDYQAKEDKLKDREEEILSLRSTLSMKEKEAKDTFLSASQVKSLHDKLNDIDVPFAEFKVGDTEFCDSDHAKKLFYIIDSVASMQHQMNLLSHDNEELQSTLEDQVRQIEHLQEEVEEHIRDKQDSEKMKSELLEIELGLENIIQKLGGNDLVGDQKSTGVRGLLPVLEKLVMAVILESENSKSKAQELGAKLFGSQKVMDELSTKVKLLEDSNQSRSASASPEGSQERSIFEAPSLPNRSEITEIEDVSPVVKKAVAPAPTAAHVRTLRKGSNDQLAINIDSESVRLIKNEETDEDKGHVFKPLNTSGLIPVQGKMIADRLDGIWVSGGRALMSRPRARLGLVAYWLFLHIWLMGTILSQQSLSQQSM